MKLEEVKQQYKDEWVLAEIMEEDEFGKPIQVAVIAHSKSKDETYLAMKAMKSKYTYHFYTGEIPRQGYAVAFYESTV